MESQIKKRLDDSYKIHQLESELYKVKKRADRFAQCFFDALESDDIEEFMQTKYTDSEYKCFDTFCRNYCPFEECKLKCFEGYEDDSVDYYAELREDEIYSKRKERGDYSSA